MDVRRRATISTYSPGKRAFSLVLAIISLERILVHCPDSCVKQSSIMSPAFDNKALVSDVKKAQLGVQI